LKVIFLLQLSVVLGHQLQVYAVISTSLQEGFLDLILKNGIV